MASDPSLVTVPASAVYDYKNPLQYGWFTINFFICSWMFARVLEVLLPKVEYQNIGKRYTELSPAKQRNVVTYIMQLLVITFAFIVLVFIFEDLIIRLDDSLQVAEVEWSSMALQALVVLYVWELIYRLEIGLPLLIHHLTTLMFFQLGLGTFFETDNYNLMRICYIMNFYATTEQLSFVALFCFRLDIFPKWQKLLFQVAAAQTFICKTAVSLFIIPYFIYVAYISPNEGLAGLGSGFGLFWQITFLPLALLLCWSQFYGAQILYALAIRCGKKYDSDGKRIKREDDDESGVVVGKKDEDGRIISMEQGGGQEELRGSTDSRDSSANDGSIGNMISPPPNGGITSDPEMGSGILQ